MSDPYTIISEPYNVIEEFTKGFQQKGGEFKLSKFVVKQLVPEGVLFYSSLTGALILVRDFEASRSILIKDCILVPSLLDEKKFVDEKRIILQKKPFRFCPCLDYWILTTTTCNANCIYCFERDYKRETMSEDTALQTASFIVNNYTGVPIALHWSGGDPLINHRVINLICDELAKSSIKFFSEITTNGYLFSKKLIKHAINSWNLSKVIVTVDGTRTIYSKIKKYIYNEDENPFAKVMSNVDYLIKLGIEVVIRTNIGTYNKDDVQRLYKYLSKRYLHKDNVSIYPLMVSNPPNGEFYMDNDTRKEIYEIIKIIKDEWKDKRKQGDIFEMPSFISGCEWDFSTEKLVVKPNGELALHQDLFDDEQFGSVSNGFRLDTNRLNQYLTEKKKNELCHICPIYPTCFNPIISFNSEVCLPADFEKCMYTTKKNMIYLYKFVTQKRDV